MSRYRVLEWFLYAGAVVFGFSATAVFFVAIWSPGPNQLRLTETGLLCTFVSWMLVLIESLI